MIIALKQVVQFGPQQADPRGGTQQELESLAAGRRKHESGSGCSNGNEQPGVPGVETIRRRYRKSTRPCTDARTAFRLCVGHEH